jgi:hypothetical protein
VATTGLRIFRPRSHVMPYHLTKDRLQDAQRGDPIARRVAALGPPMKTKVARVGVRVGDLRDPSYSANESDQSVEKTAKTIKNILHTKQKIIKTEKTNLKISNYTLYAKKCAEGVGGGGGQGPRGILKSGVDGRGRAQAGLGDNTWLRRGALRVVPSGKSGHRYGGWRGCRRPREDF